jgi:hypothetical protein
MVVFGLSRKAFHLHGVQGVASSNPAAPTIVIKHLGQSSDWLFCW